MAHLRILACVHITLYISTCIRTNIVVYGYFCAISFFYFCPFHNVDFYPNQVLPISCLVFSYHIGNGKINLVIYWCVPSSSTSNLFFIFWPICFFQLGPIGSLFSLQTRRYLQLVNIFCNYTRGAPACILQLLFGLLSVHTRSLVSHLMCDTRSVCVARIYIDNGCLYFYGFAMSALRDH